MQIVINQQAVKLDLATGEVTLDVLRRSMGLTGVKEGCREGDCGACTVLLGRLNGDRIDYQAVVSCLLPIGDCSGKHLVTIEGLNLPGLNPVQQAFIDQGAVQCGFCTPGLIVSLTGYLLSAESWNEEEALLSVAGNICRCTGYAAIRRAIRQVLAELPTAAAAPRLETLIAAGYIPAYFAAVPARLAALPHLPESARVSGKIIVAGGTDLYVQKPELLETSAPELISSRAELQAIAIEEGWCRIGGGTTIEALRRNPELQNIFPGLARHLRLVSSTQIRNRATVAGNLVNASPIGDLTILLLALDAEIELADGAASRRLPLRSFYLGYKKMDRHEDELLISVRFPLPQPGDLFNFEKVSKREYLDIASVNSACLLRMIDNMVEEVHLSAGGIAPIPLYLEKTCAYLTGREVDQATLAEALRVAQGEIAPISDVRGSAEYKQLLLRQLLKAHFVKQLPGVSEGRLHER